MDEKFTWSALKIPAILMLGFWILGGVLWQVTSRVFYLFNFLYIGLALGVGIGIYVALPRKHKYWGRRLAQLLVGTYMLVFLGLLQRENMQIEGFFLYLLAGAFAGSVIHYLVAKIVGPLLFNRGWCGWACWTVMVLDLLPFKQNRRGRLAGSFETWRILHFFASLALVLILWVGLGYRVEQQDVAELYWLIGGNVMYYGVGIGLAYLLEDNRAFCKYACPITVLLKLTSRFSLLKIKGDPSRCNECGLCAHRCPMDIRIPEYTRKGQRVLSSECIFCLECINVCSRDALQVSIGFDNVSQELLRTQEARK